MPDEQTPSPNPNPQTTPPNSESNKKDGQRPASPNIGQDGSKETIKEIHHHHYDKGGRFFPRFFWGILVIFIGLVFLAQSTGIITGLDAGRFFASIWPVFIILAGLSIMSRGGFFSGLISVVILVIVLALVAAFTLRLPIFGGRVNQNYFNQRQIQTEEISIDKQASAQNASVTIHAGAGQVAVSGGSDKLVTGNFTSNVTDLQTSSQLAGSSQNVEIRLSGGSWNFGSHYTNDLAIKLSSATPMSLFVDAGAASQNLDLSDVQVTSLNLNAGASSVNLTLGDKVDNAAVKIDSGASSVHITLPKTVGAKVTVDGGLTSRDFSDFKQNGNNAYESNNYGQSAKKVNITLHGGASSFTIDWK